MSANRSDIQLVIALLLMDGLLGLSAESSVEVGVCRDVGVL